MPRHSTKQRSRVQKSAKKTRIRKQLKLRRGEKNARHIQRKLFGSRKQKHQQLKHRIREEANGVIDHQKEKIDYTEDFWYNYKCECCWDLMKAQEKESGWRWTATKWSKPSWKPLPFGKMSKIQISLGLQEACTCSCACHQMTRQMTQHQSDMWEISRRLSDLETLVFVNEPIGQKPFHLVLWEQLSKQERKEIKQDYAHAHEYIYELVGSVQQAQKLKKEGWDIRPPERIYDCYRNGWSGNMPDCKFVVVNACSCCSDPLNRAREFHAVSKILDGPDLDAVKMYQDMELAGFVDDEC